MLRSNIIHYQFCLDKLLKVIALSNYLFGFPPSNVLASQTLSKQCNVLRSAALWMATEDLNKVYKFTGNT